MRKKLHIDYESDWFNYPTFEGFRASLVEYRQIFIYYRGLDDRIVSFEVLVN